MKGMILVSNRLQAEDRCYRVTDHAGQPLSFKIKDDEMRPALPRHTSDNPEDMRKLLDLVDKRRRKSSAASRNTSFPDPRSTQGDTHE